MAHATRWFARLGPALLMAMIWLMPAYGAIPDLEIGAAATVVNSVYGTVELAQQSYWIRAGMDVFQNETLVTAENSASRVIFKDTTQLSIGAIAQVKLDRFVFDPNPAASAVSLSFIRGAFRFVSGKLPKENYAIRTPAATISVRGTVFTVLISQNGSEFISVESGTIYVTCHSGVTVAVNAGQTTYIPSPRGSARQPTPSLAIPAVTQMDALLR
jgi:hypothetical protein